MHKFRNDYKHVLARQDVQQGYSPHKNLHKGDSETPNKHHFYCYTGRKNAVGDYSATFWRTTTPAKRTTALYCTSQFTDTLRSNTARFRCSRNFAFVVASKCSQYNIKSSRQHLACPIIQSRFHAAKSRHALSRQLYMLV